MAMYRTQLVLLLALFSIANLAKSAKADDFDDFPEIKRLEKQLFSSTVKAEKIDQLLKQLSDEKKQDSAQLELQKVGHSYIPRIIKFASTAKSVDVRYACAKIVLHLDMNYQSSPAGRELAKLYEAHAETLLPLYWKRFRKDPLDHRATAMLISAKPEIVEKWLSTSKDKQDQLRHILLRIRERNQEKYCTEKLRLYSGKQVLQSLPDVFPVVTTDKLNYCRRVVGQTANNVVRLHTTSQWKLDDKKPVGLWTFYQSVVAFRAPPPPVLKKGKFINTKGVIEQFGYNLKPYYYKPHQLSRMYNVRSRVPPFKGLYETPAIKPSVQQYVDWFGKLPLARIYNLNNPWWLKKQLPKKLRVQLSFTKRKPEEKDPFEIDIVKVETTPLKPFSGKITPALASAPAVVVLPPVLPKDTHPEIARSAEAACDRIAAEISADGTVQIVNRTELGRIFDEHKIAKGKQKPIVSYSAMIRLEIDTNKLSPRTDLKVIDLSTGNVLGHKELSWPLKEADVPQLKKLCQSALKNADQKIAGRTRVRWLGVQNTGKEQMRLRPLAVRLQTVFDQTFSQAKNLLIVQHLEARTTQEESLLLLMGLSQMTGGKPYSPQADVTIELRIKEGKAVGKTFAKTPIILSFRLRDAKHTGNDWHEMNGVVNQFDQLIKQVGEQISQQLKSIQPQSVGNTIKEMKIRRTQANTELQRAKNLFSSPFKVNPAKYYNNHKQALGHLETALKLDPTFAEPHLLLSRIYVGKDVIQRRLQEAKAYVLHPQSEPKRWPEALENAVVALQKVKGFSKNSRYEIDNTLENRRYIVSLKLLAEKSATPQAQRSLSYHMADAVAIVDRGMRTLGVSQEERIQWVDSLLQELSSLPSGFKNLRKRGTLSVFIINQSKGTVPNIRKNSATIALEEGLKKRAKHLLKEIRIDIKPQDTSLSSWVRDLRKLTRKLNDPDELIEFEKWAKSISESVKLITIKWPQVTDLGNYGRDNKQKIKNPDVPYTEIARVKKTYVDNRGSDGEYYGLSPIAVGNKWVYLVLSNKNWSAQWTYGVGGYSFGGEQQLAMVQLDGSGKPIGKLNDITVLRTNHQRKQIKVKRVDWEPFYIPKQPPIAGMSSNLFSRFHKGKLYLGTTSNGLMVFDSNQKTWKAYGTQQGFPTNMICSFFFLNDNSLYIAGNKHWGNTQHFTLDLKTDEVKLLHKATQTTEGFYAPRLVPMWWDNRKLASRFRTDMLSAKPKYRPRWRSSPFSGALDAVEIDGRHFLTTKQGLYEFDIHGKILRSWLNASQPKYSQHTRYFSIPTITTIPQRGHFMVRAGNLLVFLKRRGKGIIAFDPKKETWYGPLGNWSPYHAVGAQHGFWLSHNSSRGDRSQRQGTLYITTKDFMQAAKKSGRVYTSKQYAQQYNAKLYKYSEKLSLIERAKLFMMLRKNKHAIELLNKLLTTEPNNAEALFLRGTVQGRWGLRHPKEALKDYRALAKHPDASARMTGLFFESMIHQKSNNFEEIIRVNNKILHDFPNLHRRHKESTQWWLDYANKQISKYMRKTLE